MIIMMAVVKSVYEIDVRVDFGESVVVKVAEGDAALVGDDNAQVAFTFKEFNGGLDAGEEFEFGNGFDVVVIRGFAVYNPVTVKKDGFGFHFGEPAFVLR